MAFRPQSYFQWVKGINTKGRKRDQNARRKDRTNENARRKDRKNENARRKNRKHEGKGRDQRAKNAKRKNRQNEGKGRDQRAKNARRKRSQKESDVEKERKRDRDQQEQNERRKRKIKEGDGRDQRQKWARRTRKLREDCERLSRRSIAVQRAGYNSQRDLALEQLASHVLEMQSKAKRAKAGFRFDGDRVSPSTACARPAMKSAPSGLERVTQGASARAAGPLIF